jgi:hypothetical protein
MYNNIYILICKYTIIPKLRYFIKKRRNSFNKYLCENQNAIYRIENHLKQIHNSFVFERLFHHHRIEMRLLEKNQSAIHILEKYIDKIDWNNISQNSAATSLMKHSPYSYYDLRNYNILDLYKVDYCKKFDKFSLDFIFMKQLISLNKNPRVINILKNDYFEFIEWKYLSLNPSAIDILLENKDKIVWAYFSKNPSKQAIELLKNPININKISWIKLLENESAIDMIKKKLNDNTSLNKNFLYENIYKNKSIFKNSGLFCKKLKHQHQHKTFFSTFFSMFSFLK